MAAQRSPLLGYNHNLKYRKRVYHVQTEDSGLDNPHIFTHLFHDGSILSTAKQEYRDLVDAPDWEDQLRARMQNQHKDMMKGLIRGAFDQKIIQFFGTLEAEQEEEVPMATLPPPPKRERASSGAQPAAPAPRAPSQPAPAAPPAQPQRTPANSGVVVAMPMVIVNNQQSGAPAPTPQAAPPTAQAPASPTATGSVFRPEESKNVPESIFGSDLISEKSLDEVILAYLSEDMTED